MDINNISIKQEAHFCASYFQGQNKFHRGCAEASLDRFSDQPGTWYLNRVLVQPEEIQGQGIGTALIKKLQEILNLRTDFVILIAELGGYNGEIEKQRKFFADNGFQQINGWDGLMEFRPPKESSDKLPEKESA